MYSSMKISDTSSPYVVQLVADTEEDIANLPTKSYAPGSTCIVIGSSNVYMLNNKKEWKLL